MLDLQISHIGRSRQPCWDSRPPILDSQVSRVGLAGQPCWDATVLDLQTTHVGFADLPCWICRSAMLDLQISHVRLAALPCWICRSPHAATADKKGQREITGDNGGGTRPGDNGGGGTPKRRHTTYQSKEGKNPYRHAALGTTRKARRKHFPWQQASQGATKTM